MWLKMNFKKNGRQTWAIFKTIFVWSYSTNRSILTWCLVTYSGGNDSILIHTSSARVRTSRAESNSTCWKWASSTHELVAHGLRTRRDETSRAGAQLALFFLFCFFLKLNLKNIYSYIYIFLIFFLWTTSQFSMSLRAKWWVELV